jgi:tetratricopeptide (TPR) repeat protein
VLDRLSRDATGQVRPLLRAAQAEYAAYAGWLHQEIGNTTAAEAWTEKAMVWAYAGSHQQMVAFAAVRRSNIAWWSGRYGEAAEMAAAAVTAGRVPPGLASIAAQYEAGAYAALGDLHASEAALERAAERLSARAGSGEDELYWARMHDEDHYNAQRAKCYIELGRVGEAIALLQPMLMASGSAGRGAGDYPYGGGLAMLALAYAKDQQPEPACHFGEQALGFGLTVPLQRTLWRLRDELGGWAGEPRVREFRSRVGRECTAVVGSSAD